ncbi:neuropilin-1-like [Asterias rubens]|uniref:neuropilin-1-like n=1 Tax=Asterias rubens TaxID=7604 RepID=UPI0014552758|nr:neuropilin-1-like [Asterias rubens]
MSFNHNDISDICQLNDARKEEFPESYKQDGGFSYFGVSSNKAKPLPEETTMTIKTNQETSQAQAASTEQITTVSTELSTSILDSTSAKAVDTKGPSMSCDRDVFGLTNDSNAPASVQWWEVDAYDEEDKAVLYVTCRDDAEGRTVKSGDFFKVGTTNVTCTASDTAGNPAQCTFSVTVTVCNMNRLGMESGAIADNQITAMNVFDNDINNYGPALARLNSNGYWCGIKWTDTWIQVDFGHTVDIYGLIIQQGLYQLYQSQRIFYLMYGDDENSLMYLEGRGRMYYVAEPRSAGDDVLISVQTSSQQRMIRTRFIRIELWLWMGDLCMRFEIIGCN